MSSCVMVSNPVSYTPFSYQMSPPPHLSLVFTSSTSQMEKQQHDQGVTEDRFRNHFWFGNEEAEHVKTIMRFYNKEIRVDNKEYRIQKHVTSRQPEEFIGCVDRRLIKICENPTSTAAREKLCENSSFITLDAVHIYTRENTLALGSNMNYVRTRYLRTFWECSDGVPTRSIKIQTEGDYEYYKQKAENYALQLNECSRKHLFPTRCYLYCEPVYEAPSDFDYYSRTTKCEKYVHSACVSPVISKRTFDQPRTSADAHEMPVSFSPVGVEEKDVYDDERSIFDEDDDDDEFFPQIGYSNPINSCIAFSMVILMQGKEFADTANTGNSSYGAECMVKPNNDESSPAPPQTPPIAPKTSLVASTQISRTSPKKKSRDVPEDVFDFEEEDDSDDDFDEEYDAEEEEDEEDDDEEEPEKEDEFFDFCSEFSQPLTISYEPYTFNDVFNHGSGSSYSGTSSSLPSSSTLPSGSSNLSRSKSEPINIRPRIKQKQKRNRFSASPQLESAFSPLSPAFSPLSPAHSPMSPSVQNDLYDSISQPSALGGLMFGVNFDDFDIPYVSDISEGEEEEEE